MGLELITAPADMPITLAEAKAHLRVDHTDEDSYITSLIAAAVSRIDGRDGFLGRAIMTQQWRLTLDSFPEGDEIVIPFPPLQSIEAATYLDTNGDPQTLAYIADTTTEPARLVTADAWPDGLTGVGAISIDFTAGYADAAAVPAAIKHGLLLMVGSWYMQREQIVVGTITQPIANAVAIEALLSPYQIFAV